MWLDQMMPLSTRQILYALFAEQIHVQEGKEKTSIDIVTKGRLWFILKFTHQNLPFSIDMRYLC